MIFFILICFLLSSLSIIVFSLYVGISPMPSSRQAKQTFVALTQRCKKPKKIVELGAGWGGVAFLLAEAFPKSEVTAIEISYVPFLVSACLKKFRRVSNLKIKNKNFFKIPVSEADVIVCYLCPRIMENLKEKFEKELKQGALVLSNTFAVPGWKPECIIRTNDFWKSEIFVYRFTHITHEVSFGESVETNLVM